MDVARFNEFESEKSDMLASLRTIADLRGDRVAQSVVAALDDTDAMASAEYVITTVIESVGRGLGVLDD